MASNNKKWEATAGSQTKKALAPDEEIKQLRERIAADQARLWELEHPIQEFPKMVKGITVDTPEQEAKVLADTAEFDEVQSADGPTRKVK